MFVQVPINPCASSGSSSSSIPTALSVISFHFSFETPVTTSPASQIWGLDVSIRRLAKVMRRKKIKSKIRSITRETCKEIKCWFNFWPISIWWKLRISIGMSYVPVSTQLKISPWPLILAPFLHFDQYFEKLLSLHSKIGLKGYRTPHSFHDGSKKCSEVKLFPMLSSFVALYS